MKREVFNDGVLRATLIKDNWVVVEWLTDKVGYLSKQAVKDLKELERFIVKKNWSGWMLGSEIENTGMHKLIERFGGVYLKEHQGYKIYIKRKLECAEQLTKSAEQ